MNLSVFYALCVLVLCGTGFVLNLIADRWPVPARIRLGIVLVVVCCCAMLGMYP